MCLSALLHLNALLKVLYRSIANMLDGDVSTSCSIGCTRESH
jgi:hypothetical protein